MNWCRVALHVAEADGASLHIGGEDSKSLHIDSEIYSPDIYRGEYEITPSQSAQVLETTDKMLRENVVVAPIPSNYGLITWDGSTLTVS